jgi:hypothetical protein
MSEISEKIRKTFQEGDDIRDAGLCSGELHLSSGAGISISRRLL